MKNLYTARITNPRQRDGGYVRNNKFQEWILVDGDWGKCVYEQDFNSQHILNYFETIQSKKTITEDIKSKFKEAVKRYADKFVVPNYTNDENRNWPQEEIDSYSGETDYFDFLINQLFYGN
jgi:hypothetical protein